MGKTEEEAESLKMDEVVMNAACGEEFRVLYELLQKFNLHSTQIPQLDIYIDTLRSMTTKKSVTFGVSEYGSC